MNKLAFSPDGRRLASDDTTVLIWDTAHYASKLRPLPRCENAEELEACWKALAGNDGGAGHRSLWKLAGSGADAARFIGGRLTTSRKIEKAELDRLLADLDSDEFESGGAFAPRPGRASGGGDPQGPGRQAGPLADVPGNQSTGTNQRP